MKNELKNVCIGKAFKYRRKLYRKISDKFENNVTLIHPRQGRLTTFDHYTEVIICSEAYIEGCLETIRLEKEDKGTIENIHEMGD